MLDTRTYNADFYRAEIEHTTFLLTQSVTPEERVRLQHKLATARKYLADFEPESYNRAKAEAEADLRTRIGNTPEDEEDDGPVQMPVGRKFDACYIVIHAADPGKRIGLAKYNETGYYSTDYDWHESPLEDVEITVKGLNERLGIPADVAESMTIGSIAGWDVPGAQRAHEYFKQ